VRKKTSNLNDTESYAIFLFGVMCYIKFGQQVNEVCLKIDSVKDQI